MERGVKLFAMLASRMKRRLWEEQRRAFLHAGGHRPGSRENKTAGDDKEDPLDVLSSTNNIKAVVRVSKHASAE